MSQRYRLDLFLTQGDELAEARKESANDSAALERFAQHLEEAAQIARRLAGFALNGSIIIDRTSQHEILFRSSQPSVVSLLVRDGILSIEEAVHSEPRHPRRLRTVAN